MDDDDQWTYDYDALEAAGLQNSAEAWAAFETVRRQLRWFGENQKVNGLFRF